MTQRAEVFEENYAHYCRQLAASDLMSVKDRLGADEDGSRLRIRFFNRDYWISGSGIADASGNRPDYMTCVILAQYVLLCPDRVHQDPGWASFKDFKRASHFTNVNFFASGTEQVLVKSFAGRLDHLVRAGELLGGIPVSEGMPYDLSIRFNALPRLALLLLFNERDEDFPASGTVLFEKHGEFFLDPESLAMTSAALIRLLRDADASV